jgi:ribokinase
MGTVHVVGSVNLDLVAAVDRLPTRGETIGGASLTRHPGGKGANQALAAARMGAAATLTAAVGTDVEAYQALALLEAEDGVTLDVHPTDQPTGLALVVVEGGGENLIVVAPGANARLTPQHLPARITAAVTLVQAEVPLGTIEAALERSEGLRVCNPAPASPGILGLLDLCDVVVVNQSERALLEPGLAEFDGWLVTTLGPAGAIVERGASRLAEAAPPDVAPVDTVGAGDAFCGTLAALLAEGATIEAALPWAVTAGALATETPGAQPSLPLRRLVESRCPSPS